MSSNNLGAGVSPAGVGAYGFGTPAVAPIPGGNVNRLATGAQTGSPDISLDPATRGQYVFDDFGRRMGTTDVRHMVTLALSMKLGSSCVRDLGNRLDEIDKVTPTVGEEIKQRINEALAGLVSRALISVDAILPEPRNGQPGKTRVFLTDLTTQTPIDIAV